MKLSVDTKQKQTGYYDHFDKIIENEMLLAQLNDELQVTHDLLNNLTSIVKNETILQYDHIIPEVVMPNNMKGINKQKFEVYVEEELLKKLKRILRKVAHFIFGGSVDSIEYMKNELSYLERIKKSLQAYHKMFTTEEVDLDKLGFLKKRVVVWSYAITEEKTTSIKSLFNHLDLILHKDNAIKKEDFDIKKLNECLIKLGYNFNREKKKVEVDEKNTFSIEKGIVEDLKWDYSKVRGQISFLLQIFENRKVLDKLIDKLEEIKSSSKNIDNKLDSINDNADAEKVKVQIYDLKDELIFLESVKKVIVKHLHTLSHQLFILIKNLIK